MVQFSCRYEIALCQLNACPSPDKKGAIIFLWPARWWILGVFKSMKFKPPFFYYNTKEISLLMPMHINEHLRYYGHVSRNVSFTLFALTKQTNKYRIRATVQRSLLTQSAVNYPALFLLYVWYFSFFVCRSGRNEHVRLVTIRKESHWGSFETGGNFLKCTINKMKSINIPQLVDGIRINSEFF